MGRKTVAIVMSMWVIPTMILVNHIVPDPYMDEIFHVPQAQKYCRGNFRSWDPMITTPPGLYLFSLAYATALYPSMWILKHVSSLFELCSTSILRSSNAILAVVCGILVYDVIIHLKPNLSERRATFYAVTISLYPLHWFFTFLYYTDVASMTAVLAMYLAALKRNYWTSAMFGAVAVFMRQTNIIWMIFIATIMVIEYTEKPFADDHPLLGHGEETILQNAGQLDNVNLPNANLRRRRHKNARNSKPPISEKISMPPSYILGLVDEVWTLLGTMWHLKQRILMTFWPFVLITQAFALFVIWNGSIVLGAKHDHTVSLHFTQIMYFGMVSSIVIAPLHYSISNAISIYKSFSNNKLEGLSLWLLALVLGFASVHFFSIAHPYLLADNRHYTFYIWRKIINAHWSSKYLLIPLYVYSWFSIFGILGKTQRRLWIMFFFLACAAVLVPAPLIELRYYSVPIFFLFFHSQIDDISWVLMASAYAVVDVLTLSMFLFRPFEWAHQPGLQRFIW